MNQVADCGLFLEADDSSLVYYHKDVEKLNKIKTNFVLIYLIRSDCRF